MGVANPLTELAILIHRMRTAQTVYYALKKSMKSGQATKRSVEQCKCEMRLAETNAMNPCNEIIRKPHLHSANAVALARMTVKFRKVHADYFTYFNDCFLRVANQMEKDIDKRLKQILSPAEMQTEMFSAEDSAS